MKSRNRKRQEQERMQMELSRLHLGSAIRQFDPHFTFNVLSSVGALIMTGEKELAYDHLIKLSCLLRSVLKDGSDIVKPLDEELDFVRKYLEIQKSRMGSRIEWNIEIDEKVDLGREVPKLIIQIFVENAIKHGLEAREEGGRLNVNLYYNTEGLEITIKDNGIGREAAAKLNSAGTGNGVKIITAIFHQMNKTNRKQARLVISDLMNNNEISGTEVKIIIPESYSFTF
jgi:sensor histidine kinase YesM